MTDDEMYKRLDFIISIIKPWNELHAFLQLPYALDSKFSDPVIKARGLAITVQHQTDFEKLEQGNSLSDKKLIEVSPAAMRMRDLCNTIKHIERTGNKHHAWITGICAESIVNENGSFQFVRNRIGYHHEQDGEFDLMNDLYKATKFWAKRRSIDLSGITNWDAEEVQILPKSPQDAIYLLFDPSICIHQGSQDISTNRLVDGKLEKFDHDNVSMAILDVRENTPETIQSLCN